MPILIIPFENVFSNCFCSVIKDGQLAVAPLPTVDFSQLLSQDPSETNKLLTACRTHGFFYLDLRGNDTKRVLEDWKKVLLVMEKYFDQPLEVKMRDDRQSDTHG